MRINPLYKLLLLTCGFLWAGVQEVSAQCATPISSFPYNEDFESTNGGFLPGGSFSDWTWGTPAKAVITGAANGNKCWITGGLTGGAYNNSESSTLTSPCFDFSSLVNPQISFSVFWETEKKFDGANLQYSTDQGATWLLLGSSSDNSCTASNWYNNGSVTYIGNQNGWSGNIQPTVGSCQGGSGSGQWVTASHDLSFLAGQPKVLFRFRFGAGTTCNSYDGFAIDDINIAERLPNSGDFLFSCTSSHDVTFNSSASACASTYAWDFDDIASGANNSSTLPFPTHSFVSPGVHNVTLTISYAIGAPVVVQHPVTIMDLSILPLLQIFCNGDKTAAIVANVNGGSGPFFYSWNTTPPQTTALLQNIGAGTYTVTVNAADACSNTASYTVTEPTALNVGITVKDASCNKNNGSITASVSGGTSPYSYLWSDGSSNAALTGIGPGTYWVSVTDNNGCNLIKDNIPVINSAASVIVNLGPDLIRCPGQKVILDPGPAFASYLWQDNSTVQTFQPVSTGKYWVTVTNSEGCTGSDTINIRFFCPLVFFPGAFTPNHDGKNDHFGAAGEALSLIRSYRLRVYDRYGQLVFYTTDPYQYWDGTNKGKPYNSGAFAWYAEYTLEGKLPDMQSGTVLLIR